jgi:hypothetical protein
MEPVPDSAFKRWLQDEVTGNLAQRTSGYFSPQRLRAAGAMGLLIAVVVSTGATVRLSSEIGTLRQNAQGPRENPEHVEALRRGSQAEVTLNELRPEYARVQGQKDLLTAQLTMATTRINDLEARLNLRDRIVAARSELSAAQRDGIELIRGCSKFQPNDFLLEIEKWTKKVRAVLTKHGWNTEAARGTTLNRR